MKTKTGIWKIGSICGIAMVFFSGMYISYQESLKIKYRFVFRRLASSNATLEIFAKDELENGYVSQTVEFANLSFLPECENLLDNITQGRWIRKVDLAKSFEERQYWITKEREIENELQRFWVKRGIQMGFWRQDNRCGYKNYEERVPNSTWPMVGSWCNARGKRPCCTDVYNGFCSKPSKRTCECMACVDLRKYLHAEASEWVVSDARCRWKNFTAEEACGVIEQSPFNDLYFVGDSFIRNMFRTFVMLVTADTVHGAWHESMSLVLRNLCTEQQQFFWKECRKTLFKMSEILYKNELCGGKGKAEFEATMMPLYNLRFSGEFYDLVVSKLGVPGSLIIVSVGFHMGCASEKEINYYLGPAVDAIEKFYGGPTKSKFTENLSGRWPQIILSLPLSIGLLKPTKFLVLQNSHKCGKYVNDMKIYASKHDIHVFDFRPLTTLIRSFDGTHHGMNVNLMKNQMLINFIASLSNK